MIVATSLASWWIINWLEEYAYRITFSPLHVLSGLIIVLVVSGATIISKVRKAAKSDPVRALRYE